VHSPLRNLRAIGFCMLAFASLSTLSTAQNVTTWHNDNNRTGWQQNETILTQSNVSAANSFGLLWQWPVTGNVYAQPLAVANVQMNLPNCQSACGLLNLVFVATERDMLYAFNAGSNSQTPVWSLDLAGALGVGGTPVNCASPPSNFMWCGRDASVGQYMGVTGTPVIDVDSNTLYVAALVVVQSQEHVQPSPRLAHWYLFAVDITSGTIKASTVMSGSIAGSAPSTLCGTSSGGTRTFEVSHLQRPALLLLSAVVYVGFSAGPGNGHSEFLSGWLFGYRLSGSTFSQTAVFSSTPYGSGGGIWQSGAAPASDGSYIYLDTGNGTFDLSGVQNPSSDAGNTLLKLNPSNLAVSDSYTPSNVFSYHNNQGLCATDEDFGAGGVLLPTNYTYTRTGGSGNCTGGCRVVINADKRSNLYVADRANLGGFNASGGNNVETVETPFPLQDPKQGYWSSPAYWYDGTHYWLYYAPSSDKNTANPYAVNAYQLATSGPSGPVSQTPTATTSILFCNYSSTPAGSWNGTTKDPTTGIVWKIENQNTGNPGSGTPACLNNGYTLPAALHAFNAANLSAPELYSSRGLQTSIGVATTFSTPTVFNGHVYVGTQTKVNVFGLCKTQGRCLQ
jgi:hypothetical protein